MVLGRAAWEVAGEEPARGRKAVLGRMEESAEVGVELAVQRVEGRWRRLVPRQSLRHNPAERRLVGFVDREVELTAQQTEVVE